MARFPLPAKRRSTRRPWPAALLIVSLLVMVLPALRTAPGGAAQELDAAGLTQDTIAAMDTAGSYRFLRYDVLATERQLDTVGEVNLSEGGRFVAVDDGAITTADLAIPSTLDDAALRFFAAAGTGWVFDRIETEQGQIVYVVLETPPADINGRDARASFLVIDEATRLPLWSGESGTDQAGPYAYETVYLDYGDAVRTNRAAATPAPGATPVAAGCGNQASGPTEVAEAFVAAATAMDLERAARCFAPDSQPSDWEDVFLGGDADTFDDITGCRGRPYIVTESKIRSDVSAIIFTFDQACAVASLDPWQRDLYDADTLTVPTVVVQAYFADDRWFVRDAFALVAD